MDGRMAEFMKLVTALAEDQGLAALVVAAVVPSEDGFTVGAGAASRMDDTSGGTDTVLDAMTDAAQKAVAKLKKEPEEPFKSYLN